MMSQPKLKARREALGISQYALAKAVGKSQSYVARIEAGRSSPGVCIAIELAAALKTTVEELFGQLPHEPQTSA